MQTASDQTRCCHSRVKLTVLTLVKARSASSPSSRPIPLFLYPPNGPPSSQSFVPALMATAPACRPSDISYAVVSDEVKTAIDKPQSVSLARVSAWAALSILTIGATGPKVSSW